MKRHEKPISCCRSRSRLRIDACTETSSADTGSSATRIAGETATRAQDRLAAAGRPRARADSGSAARRAGRRDRRASTTFSSRSRPRASRCSRSGSPTISPHDMRGLSDEYGSWNTMCSSRRSGRISRRERWVMSRPLSRICRRSARPAARRNSRRCDLPLPDSPTRPRDSPGPTRTRHRRPRGRSRRRREPPRPEVLHEAADLEDEPFSLTSPLIAPGMEARDEMIRARPRAARGPSTARSSARGQRGANAQAAASSRERRDAARDLLQPPRDRPARARHRAEQADRVRMLRLREQLVHRRLLGLPAGVHDKHAVGDIGDDAEVVRDQDDRGAEPLADVADQVEDPGLDRHVERGRRLVRDQDLRIAGERHRDHHALPHAARELVRVLVDPPVGRRDADEVEQLDRARRARRAPRARDGGAAPRRSGCRP